MQQVETPVPIQSIQIKDDYCYHGDWLEANENWPGLDRTAREIFKHGYKAGIWIAPFKVDERSKLFKEHQNWLVQDENGEPMVKMVDKGVNQYVLDSTNNDVRNYLYDVFRTLRKMGLLFLLPIIWIGVLKQQIMLSAVIVEKPRYRFTEVSLKIYEKKWAKAAFG